MNLRKLSDDEMAALAVKWNAEHPKGWTAGKSLKYINSHREYLRKLRAELGRRIAAHKQELSLTMREWIDNGEPEADDKALRMIPGEKSEKQG